MKIAVDFSQDADKNWSNIAACWKSEEGIDLSGVTQISMDIWYETEKLTEGELKLAFYSNCGIDVNTSLYRCTGRGRNRIDKGEGSVWLSCNWI